MSTDRTPRGPELEPPRRPDAEPAPPGGSPRKRRRPSVIEPYLGYGTPSRLLLSGRVLKERGASESSRLDSKWRNLLNTFRLFRTDEVAGVRVVARVGKLETAAISDADGYFRVELELPEAILDGGWQALELELDDLRGAGVAPARARGEVLVPPATARFGVISDIDDTVVSTHVTSTLTMLATVLFSNAHVRMPFHGIAEFYRALHNGTSGSEGNPIFYVSNGPWNFYGLLIEFFKLNRIPLGPLFLRDFSARMAFAPRHPQGTRKLLHIDRILAAYPDLQFILVGDSGERDPEIYAEVVKRYPERIRAIYIRSVDPRAERLAAIAALADTIRNTPTQFVLAQDSAEAAAHAAGEGFIDSAALELIRRAD